MWHPLAPSQAEILQWVPGCPISVAAARVPETRQGDAGRRFATGWGASPDEALFRCALECAERCSAQIFGKEEIIRAGVDALGMSALSPPEILMISERQYAGRELWNASHPGFNELPVPWHKERAIDWIAASPVLGSAVGWLPAGLCFLGHARDREAGLPPADSNGVAAGSTLEDAAIRAFTELIERDAVAIWWYNRLERPLLSLSELADPLITAYAEWSEGRGRQMHLLDLTHDFEVPVVAAVSHSTEGDAIAIGFGAAASSIDAARHAIGELAQFECNIALIEAHVIAQHDLSPEASALFRWWRTARMTDHRQLASMAAHRAPTERLDLTLGRCHRLCQEHRLRFFALDLTRPAIGVPVVRVFVPGLRSMWARFAAGRLYDVPVRLGWLQKPLSITELNPTPLMF